MSVHKMAIAFAILGALSVSPAEARRARNPFRAIADVGRSAIDGARRAAEDAARKAREVAEAVARKARETAEAAARAAREAAERAKRLAEEGIRLAKEMAERVKNLLSGQDVELPGLDCKVNLRPDRWVSSFENCAKALAEKMIKALPFLQGPIRAIIELMGEVKGDFENIAKCAKETITSSITEMGSIAVELMNDPGAFFTKYLWGGFKALGGQSLRILKMLDVTQLLSKVAGLMGGKKKEDKKKEEEKKKAEKKKAAEKAGSKPAEDPDTDVGADESASSSEEGMSAQKMGNMLSIAGPVANLLIDFINDLPEKLFTELEAMAKDSPIKGAFACVPVVKGIVMRFKGALVGFLRLIVGKADDVLQIFGPILEKVLGKGIEVVIGILSGTDFFKRLKEAVTSGFIDNLQTINSKMQQAVRVSKCVKKDPIAAVRRMANALLDAIPFLRLTFWVDFVKDPIKEKITSKLQEWGGQAVDWVLSEIRGLVLNVVKRVVAWICKVIPYATYVSGTVSAVVLWIVRVAWDKVIDPVIRAVVMYVLNQAVETIVDVIIEVVAAALKEGTQRLDAFLMQQKAKLIDKVPVPGPVGMVVEKIFEIYKTYIEPHISSMANHMNALNDVMQALPLVGKGQTEDPGSEACKDDPADGKEAEEAKKKALEKEKAKRTNPDEEASLLPGADDVRLAGFGGPR
jgi:hypothetical protein